MNEDLIDKIESINTQLHIEKLEYFIKNEKHEFLTTHKKLCFVIIQRIHRRLLLGHRFGAIKISNNELVIDGNHRYIAYKIAGVKLEIIKGNRSFSDELTTFNEIEIDTEQDWDLNCPLNRKYCDDSFLPLL